jgi:hypothetical protein
VNATAATAAASSRTLPRTTAATPDVDVILAGVDAPDVSGQLGEAPAHPALELQRAERGNRDQRDAVGRARVGDDRGGG